METIIQGMKEVAEFLNISERHAHKLKKPDVWGSLDTVLMERTVWISCRDGKRRKRRILYSYESILRRWELQRGGTDLVPSHLKKERN